MLKFKKPQNTIDDVLDHMKDKVATVINVSDAKIEDSKKLESERQDSSRSNTSSLGSNVFGLPKAANDEDAKMTPAKKRLLKMGHSIDNVFESMKSGVPSVVNISSTISPSKIHEPLAIDNSS